MDNGNKDNRIEGTARARTLDVWAWLLRASVPAFVVGLGITGISNYRNDHDQLTDMSKDVEFIKLKVASTANEVQRMMVQIRETERELDRILYRPRGGDDARRSNTQPDK